LLSTSTTPSGTGGEIGDRYRRVEIEDRGVAALIREHERQVGDFGRDAGLRPKAGTLAEVAEECRILAQPFVIRTRFTSLYFIAAFYVLPLYTLIGMIGRPNRPPVLVPAFICGAAVLFAVIRLVSLPELRRFRWLGIAALMAAGVLFPLLLL
jgi:hypothetical protein